MGRLWYLNGDFDLELACEPIGRLERAVAEMSLWFLLAAEADDRVICDRTPPPEYLEHLAEAGLVVANPAEEGQRYDELSAEAWGWTERSRDRLASFGASLSHPPLEVVARVNGRLFAHRITQELGLGVPGATQVEAGRLLRGESPLSGPQVVKPLHSAAGRGMLRSLDGSWNPQQQTVLEVIEHQAAPVVLEPWLVTQTYAGGFMRTRGVAPRSQYFIGCGFCVGTTLLPSSKRSTRTRDRPSTTVCGTMTFKASLATSMGLTISIASLSVGSSTRTC